MPRCPDCDFHSDDLGVPCAHHPDRRTASERHLEDHPDAPLLGHLIDDRFAALRIAGVGGMGWVYDARDESQGSQRVALKVLKAAHADDDIIRERFNREARILGLLNHPNLVTLFASGALPDGALYMAMEYVEGRTLGQVLQRPKYLGVSRILNICEGVAEGLGEAHRNGIVHRDLKPANVLLVRDAGGQETPRIVDFGIARFDEALRHLTQTGMVFGTPSYMSPEQALGQTGIGPPADVYAFGVLLFRMLSGDLPFDHRVSLQVLMAHVNKPVPTLVPRPDIADDVPPALLELTLRCLEKKAEARYTDGAELAVAIRDIQETRAPKDDDPTLVGAPSPLLQEADALPTELLGEPAHRAAPPPDEPTELIVAGADAPVPESTDTDLDGPSEAAHPTGESLPSLESRRTIVSDETPATNDLMLPPPADASTPLRSSGGIPMGVWVGVAVVALIGVIIGLVVALSEDDTPRPPDEPTESGSEATPTPTGVDPERIVPRDAWPEDVARKIDEIGALRLAQSMNTSANSGGPERDDEINNDIAALLEDIEEAGYVVAFGEEPDQILVLKP